MTFFVRGQRQQSLFAQLAALQDVAAAEQQRPFLLARLNIPHHDFEVVGMDQRAHAGILIPRHADANGLGPGDELRDEIIVHVFVNDKAGQAATAFALAEVDAKERAGHRPVRRCERVGRALLHEVEHGVHAPLLQRQQP